MNRATVAKAIEKRNPEQNGFRTICTSAVLEYLRVTKWRYSQSLGDVCRILRRHGWSGRSRKSQAGNCTVSQLRDKVRAGKIDMELYRGVFVDRHVLLMKNHGLTVVDTDPRKSDRRKVRAVYAIRHGKEKRSENGDL